MTLELHILLADGLGGFHFWLVMYLKGAKTLDI